MPPLTPSLFRCPVRGCELPLDHDEDARRYLCGNGHSFDVAREGYVNLLLAHQKRTAEPGDSKEMVAARRRFLERGWYLPVRERLGELVPTRGDVLDAGCGEGWWSDGWPMPGRQVWAVDVSRAAVRLAARRSTDIRYAVASVHRLPMVSGALDAVVSVFAPVWASEVERVLRPGGALVTVKPGPDHLMGLKEVLYADPEAHSADPPLTGIATRLTPSSQERIRYDIELPTSGDVVDLFVMTPFSWNVDEPTAARVRSLPSLTTPVDAVLTVYRP